MLFKRFVAAGALLGVILCGPGAAIAGSGRLIANPVVEDGPAVFVLTVFFQYDEPDPDSWLPLFNEASRLFFNATERQIQFGGVGILSAGCPNAKENADIVISAGIEGARADARGLGITGRHVYLSQVHKSTSGAILGQFGFAQQLARYVFGLEPEHAGKATQLALPEGTPVRNDFPEPYFCALPLGAGVASLMDGGSVVFPDQLRFEFCTRTDLEGVSAHFEGFSPALITVLGQEVGLLTRNMQQVRHGKSAWETIQEVALARDELNIFPPFRDPIDDDSGHVNLVPGVTWVEVLECTQARVSGALVLVIDRSGSMSVGGAMDLAKEGARLVVDNLIGGESLGIVSFSDSARVDFPLQVILGDTTKAAAVAAIDAIMASGSTNITDGLAVGLNEIVMNPRQSPELMVLLTDGFHNVGDDPITSGVVDQVAGEDVIVNTIALGTGADAGLMQAIADRTGGVSAVATDPSQLPELLLGLSSGATTLSLASVREPIAPSERIVREVFVDMLTPIIRVTLQWEEGDLDLTLVRPDSSVVNPLDTGVTFTDLDKQTTYEIDGAASGTWQLVVDAVATTVVQNFLLETVDTTQPIQFTITASQGVVVFPEAVLIEALMVGDGPPVTGVSVLGTVLRPDGTEVPLQLFDDGKPAHGDRVAGDGIYANHFAQYAGNGRYRGRLFVVNTSGSQVGPDEQGALVMPVALPPFQRERPFSFTVSNAPTLPRLVGSGVVEPATVMPVGRTIDTNVFDEVVTGVLVLLSPEEPVAVEQIVFRGAGTGDETAITKVKLYIDGDQDGAIDPTGPYACPAAVGTYDADDGVVVFRDVVWIPSGESVQLLLAYEMPLPAVIEVAAVSRTDGRALAGVGPLALLFGLPVLLAALLGRFRRVPGSVRVLLVAVTLTVLSCSGGGGGGGGGAADPVPDPVEGATFSATMVVGDLVLRGGFSDQPIVTTGDDVAGETFVVP